MSSCEGGGPEILIGGLHYTGGMRKALACFVVLGCAGLMGCSRAPADQSAAPASAPPAASAAAPGPGGTLTGDVVETMNSGGYTYVRLRADGPGGPGGPGGKDTWVAASEFPVTVGETLTVPLEMPMQNFHSTTLKRDFALIYFVSQVARNGQPLPPAGAGGIPMPMGSHGSADASAAHAAPSGQGAATAANPTGIAVTPNPPPPGGLSVADVWAQRKALAGKEVTIRGTVVKVNNEIMNRNWFHLQDGSGKEDAGTNDLAVTTQEVVRIGDVVTVTGTLGIDKDFGAGYTYGAILEQAVVKQP